MASLLPMRRDGWGLAALVWLSMTSVSLAAQSSPPPDPPVVLDRKQVSRLVVSEDPPEYPTLARINYIQGHVRVQIVVSRQGRVEQAHVVRGHPLLAAAALRAIRRWIYRPFVSKAGPSTFLTTVDLNFSLHTRKIEQLPRSAEYDFSRQVKPPEVLTKPLDRSATSSVRLRLLLNDQGQVIDSESLKGATPELDTARRSVEHWTFRPARWGTLPLPWYLDVDVPVQDSDLHSAADPASR